MSLNWNIEKVKEWQTFSEDERAVVDAMIWLSMAIGIGKITEENADEVYARVQLIQCLHGAFMNRGGKDKFITKDDIKRLVGLETNASSLTRPAFNKYQLLRYYREKGV